MRCDGFGDSDLAMWGLSATVVGGTAATGEDFLNERIYTKVVYTCDQTSKLLVAAAVLAPNGPPQTWNQASFPSLDPAL